jgi:hypothetical protein
VISGCANTGDVVNNFFRVQNASLCSAFQTNFYSFFRRSVMGLAILEKFKMLVDVSYIVILYIYSTCWRMKLMFYERNIAALIGYDNMEVAAETTVWRR